MRLKVGPHEVDFGEMRCSLDFAPKDQVVHVSIHHEAFADLPDDVRAQMVLIAMDTTLGEDTVELWLGSIDGAKIATPDHRHPLAALPGTIRAMLTEHDLDPTQKLHERWASFEISAEHVHAGRFRQDIAIGTSRLMTMFDPQRTPDLHRRLRRAGAVLGTGFALERDYGDFLVFDHERSLEVVRRAIAQVPEFTGVEWHQLDPSLSAAPISLS